MNQKLYDRMDWGRIEGLVYSEESQPHELLGAFVTDDGILVQAFLPTAARALVRCGDQETPMELMEENGFFAALLPGRRFPRFPEKQSAAHRPQSRRRPPDSAPYKRNPPDRHGPSEHSLPEALAASQQLLWSPSSDRNSRYIL